MLHITIEELGELQEALAALDVVLETLDRIGAGIAAIHVDAAIDQLRNNLDIDAAQNASPRAELPESIGFAQLGKHRFPQS